MQMDPGINLKPAITKMTRRVNTHPAGRLLSATLPSSDRFPPDIETLCFHIRFYLKEGVSSGELLQVTDTRGPWRDSGSTSRFGPPPVPCSWLFLDAELASLSPLCCFLGDLEQEGLSSPFPPESVANTSHISAHAVLRAKARRWSR